MIFVFLDFSSSRVDGHRDRQNYNFHKCENNEVFFFSFFVALTPADE